MSSKMQSQSPSTRRYVRDSQTPKSEPREQRPISIIWRMFLSFWSTIFGLIFFYLVMVFLSSIAKNITLDPIEPNGWARSASRFTAVTTIPALVLFMLSSPSSTSSLFFAVMSACAQFCHFVIISSDLGVYVKKDITQRVFRDDSHLHPLFSKLPIFTPHVLGTIGFFAFLVVTTERCFGNSLKFRKSTLPATSRFATTYITFVYTLWLVDRVFSIFVIAKQNGLQVDMNDVSYPLGFLLPLWAGTAVMWGRIQKEHVRQVTVGKQKKAD